jgi:sugar phosphate isomerase/epimerase
MAKIKLCAFSDESGKTLAEQIHALKRNGIPYMEMRNIDGKVVTKLTLEEARDYRRALADEGLAVWSVGSPIGKSRITGDFGEVLDTVKHGCEVALELGTDKIRMFSFHHATEEREEVLSRLCRMVEVASTYGVGLYHENEKGIYGDIAQRVQDIMDNVPGLKHIYDPANFLQVGESADDTLSRFHAKADYFHIKDVITATGELVPAGHGDGNIARLVDMIEGEKVLTLEPHLAIFDGYAQIDETKMKHKYVFKSNPEAFDAAANALKSVLLVAGYREESGEFVR